jgi:cobalt-zinc-cadmium resistance protein CzcA
MKLKYRIIDIYRRMIGCTRSALIGIMVCSGGFAIAQQNTVTLEEAIQQTLRGNKNIEAASLDIEYQRQIKRTATDVGKTNVMYMQGQYNSYVKTDNNITISQSIPFPTVFTSQNALDKSLVKGAEFRKAVTENELVYQVKQVYHRLLYLMAREALLEQQDSIYTNFVKATDLRYRTGETRMLEKTTAETQRNEVLNQLAQNQADIRIYQQQLAVLMNRSHPVAIASVELSERKLGLPLDSVSISQNPNMAYLKQLKEIAANEKKVASAKVLPDLSIGYFNQTLIGTPVNASGELATKSDRFQGFQVGLAIPLWFGPQSAKVKAAAIHRQKAQTQFELSQTAMQAQWQLGAQEYIKNKSSVNFYQSAALANAALILKQSDIAFRNGEIDYTEYWLAVRNAMQIRENYLNSLNSLNQSVIHLEFLAGIQ